MVPLLAISTAVSRMRAIAARLFMTGVLWMSGGPILRGRAWIEVGVRDRQQIGQDAEKGQPKYVLHDFPLGRALCKS